LPFALGFDQNLIEPVLLVYLEVIEIKSNLLKINTMEKLCNCYAQSENQIKQGKYVPPEITVLEITLEKGFATSSASGTEDWGSLTW
jgi:hypothetical protein